MKFQWVHLKQRHSLSRKVCDFPPLSRYILETIKASYYGSLIRSHRPKWSI